MIYFIVWPAKIVSDYDQEIPQSQTADKPMAPRGTAAQQSRDTRIGQTKQSNQLSLPHQHTGHFLYQPPVTCASMYPLTWFKRPDDDTVLVDCKILPARKKLIRRKIYLWRRANKPAIDQDMTDFTREFVATNTRGDRDKFGPILENVQFSKDYNI